VKFAQIKVGYGQPYEVTVAFGAPA